MVIWLSSNSCTKMVALEVIKSNKVDISCHFKYGIVNISKFVCQFSQNGLELSSKWIRKILNRYSHLIDEMYTTRTLLISWSNLHKITKIDYVSFNSWNNLDRLVLLSETDMVFGKRGRIRCKPYGMRALFRAPLQLSGLLEQLN